MTRTAPPATGRGRPRQFDRDVALEAAMHLFWSKGYEATSIRDLTRTMNISLPSLYAAFGSKEALYAEALSRYSRTADTIGLARLRAPDVPVRAAVEGYLMAAAAFLSAPEGDHPTGCMVTLGTVNREESPALHERLCAERSEAFSRLQQRITTAVEAGELPATLDARALARFVHGLLCGMAVLARDGIDREELERIVHIAMHGWDAHVGAA
uniref:TetR/AcrR family transcriptional regulator n=1 Tax=Oceanicella sp. SM1341 TaxID=1548889 RepID=UPI000E4758F4|nr:TetR/AcrR family transcriptional regulator [Oceanicella sp. SM1341]